MKKTFGSFLLSIFLLLAIVQSVSAAAVTRAGAGTTTAALSSVVDTFRNDLGGTDNGSGSSYTTGRREIFWDLVPDNLASPNSFPGGFFNSTVQRGVKFSAPCRSASLRVSADVSNPTNTPVRFGEINSSYSSTFTTFEGQRLLSVINSAPASFSNANCQSILVTFSIPGTNIPATVNGFGIVFTDVDTLTNTKVQLFDINGVEMGNYGVLNLNGGLSFFGVSFNAGERISSVVIHTGRDNLSVSNTDGPNGIDVAAISTIIYGEPRAAQFHSGDFDGDGSSDSAIFRPSNGQWFTFNSGSNTVTIEQWGINGDIPVDGDFDGDSRADLAVFRPSNGQWWFKRSSDGTSFGATFGQNGDKPVVGDYDKDGKTDIAVWRPSNGNYFVLRSSSNFSNFYSYGFGTNGDIPVQGGAQ